MEMEKKEIVNPKEDIIMRFGDDDIVGYDVFVSEIILTWNGNLGYGKVSFRVDRVQFQKILENPLKDYLEFGVQDILYVYIYYVPIYFKDGMEIKGWKNFGYIYEYGRKDVFYEKEIGEIIKEMEEMDYTNINYYE